MGPMKRPAAAPTQTAKKPKVEEVQTPRADPRLAKVSSGILQADIAESAKDMLTSMLGLCLSVPRDKRDRYQESVAGIIGEVLNEVHTKLRERLDKAQGTMDECSDRREELLAEVHRQDEELKAAEDIATVKMHDLAGVARNFRTARAALQAAEKRGDEVRRSAQKCAAEREALTEAIHRLQALAAEGVGPPVATEEGRQAEAADIVDDLVLALRSLNFDAALLALLPGALRKPPSSRGSFEATVIMHLSDEAARRTAALDTCLQQAEPSRAEADDEVAQATTTLETARQEQLDTAAIYKVAADSTSRCKAELDQTHKIAKANSSKARAGEKQWSAATVELKYFVDVPLRSFQELLEQTTTPPQAVEKPITEDTELEAPAAEAAAAVAGA